MTNQPALLLEIERIEKGPPQYRSGVCGLKNRTIRWEAEIRVGLEL